MKIESIVIHEIEKKDGSTGAEAYITDECLDNDAYTNIVEKLDRSFLNKTLKRAKFSEEGFKSIIKNFSNFSLLDVSKSLTKKLKNEIKNVAPAKGGYLVFCRYTISDEFFAVFIVRNTESEFLKQKDIKGKKSWDINPAVYLDSEHFAMGVRINLDVLNNPKNDDRYISLVKGTTDISKYFENWVGLDDTKQESKDADALYNLSNNIDLPEDIKSRDDFKKRIFDYAKARGRKPINMRDLSKHLYDNENTITEYCDKNNIDIDGEFKLSPKNRNRFYKISVKAGDIELIAPRSNFSGDGIAVSKDGKSVVIKSKELADKIRESLDG
ncbi:MAG: nucleoid-associated protein [Methylococcales bacterium]